MDSRILQWGRQGFRRVWHSAIEFVYPPTCCFCHSTVVADASEDGFFLPRVCAECDAALAPEIRHSCDRCAAPVGPHLETTAGCSLCRQDRFRFDQIIRLGVYEGALRNACLAAKDAPVASVAVALAELLWQHEGGALERVSFDVVHAVPSHWSRGFVRPGHPVVSIAQTLARRLQVELGTSILFKTRRTIPQTRLSPTQRRRNLRGAFGIRRGSDVAGRDVLLVDDVLTTGTTANEAARVLKRAGARSVTVAVIARGVGRSTKSI